MRPKTAFGLAVIVGALAARAYATAFRGLHGEAWTAAQTQAVVLWPVVYVAGHHIHHGAIAAALGSVGLAVWLKTRSVAAAAALGGLAGMLADQVPYLLAGEGDGYFSPAMAAMGLGLAALVAAWAMLPWRAMSGCDAEAVA